MRGAEIGSEKDEQHFAAAVADAAANAAVHTIAPSPEPRSAKLFSRQSFEGLAMADKKLKRKEDDQEKLELRRVWTLHCHLGFPGRQLSK